MKYIVLTGRSGSGKTTALKMFEDLGYYCSDNIPLTLIPNFFDWAEAEKPSEYGVCVGLDVRNGIEQLSSYLRFLEQAKEKYNISIIYLDTVEDKLVQRFSATRRKHPLSSPQYSLEHALQLEKDALHPLASMSNLIVDTSELSIQELRTRLNIFAEKHNSGLNIYFESFGFKNGIPKHADLIFDARILANPYWNQELRALSGLDQPIQAFFAQTNVPERFIESIYQFLLTWIPSYQEGDRAYLTVAIGCTGGQHRSVYVVEQLVDKLSAFAVEKKHRDIKN